jgi:hypothetical protein
VWMSRSETFANLLLGDNRDVFQVAFSSDFHITLEYRGDLPDFPSIKALGGPTETDTDIHNGPKLNNWARPDCS